MRTKKLLVVSLGVIVALLVVGGSIAGIAYYLIGDDDETMGRATKRPNSLAFILFLNHHSLGSSKIGLDWLDEDTVGFQGEEG